MRVKSSILVQLGLDRTTKRLINREKTYYILEGISIFSDQRLKLIRIKNLNCMRHIGIMSLIALLFFACSDEEDMVPNDGQVMVPNGTEESAEYLVTFTINWNSTDFPTDYPSNAHFSRLIGWSHDAEEPLFTLGTMASDGIKNMAETGGISPLEDELKALIEGGKGFEHYIGSGLSSGSGEIEMSVKVTEQYSSVTLATMVAPSPDWYIAVVDINLMENNSFVNEKTVEAHVYDAGTDSGSTYSSPNEVTDPQMPITLFVDSPLGDGIELNATIAIVNFKKM